MKKNSSFFIQYLSRKNLLILSKLFKLWSFFNFEKFWIVKTFLKLSKRVSFETIQVTWSSESDGKTLNFSVECFQALNFWNITGGFIGQTDLQKKSIFL